MWSFKVISSLALIAAVCGSAIPAQEDEQLVARNGQFNLYYIYTRLNPDEPRILRTSVSSVQNSLFDPSRDTVIIVHGHQENAFSSLNPLVKDSFLVAYDANVISVDWELFAGQSYSSAVDSVPEIGLGIASVLQYLVQFGLQLERVHLVGFNLGAHVVGFTGRYLGGRVGRISGLDPSGNRWGSRSGRLDKDDALYVEVIHTDAGITGNGIGTDIGDVDFHPNGGTNQPGCLFNTCDHNRAWELFAASVLYNHFVGRRCVALQLGLNTCNREVLRMGNGEISKPDYTPGTYRVNTDSRFPF